MGGTSLPHLPGVTIEDKGLSATIHYRNAADPEAARAATVAALLDSYREQQRQLMDYRCPADRRIEVEGRTVRIRAEARR